jgi:hypothetical protein
VLLGQFGLCCDRQPGAAVCLLLMIGTRAGRCASSGVLCTTSRSAFEGSQALAGRVALPCLHLLQGSAVVLYPV